MNGNIVIFADSRRASPSTENEALRQIVALTAGYVNKQSALCSDASLWRLALINVPFTTAASQHSETVELEIREPDFQLTKPDLAKLGIPAKLESGLIRGRNRRSTSPFDLVIDATLEMLEVHPSAGSQLNLFLLAPRGATIAGRAALLRFCSVSILPAAMRNRLNVSVATTDFSFASIRLENHRDERDFEQLVEGLNITTFPCVDKQLVLVLG